MRENRNDIKSVQHNNASTCQEFGEHIQDTHMTTKWTLKNQYSRRKLINAVNRLQHIEKMPYQKYGITSHIEVLYYQSMK